MSLIGVIMLMGLVARTPSCFSTPRVRKGRRHRPRRALMHAGRKRFRPILMTTFALIAGMMPVAIGVGRGGEFPPMAVAIIGGTITSTLLTLLVVPTFYDSIEIARDRAIAKFRRRVPRFTAFGNLRDDLAPEAVLTLFVLVRFVWRNLVWAVRLATGRRPPAAPAWSLRD